MSSEKVVWWFSKSSDNSLWYFSETSRNNLLYSGEEILLALRDSVAGSSSCRSRNSRIIDSCVTLSPESDSKILSSLESKSWAFSVLSSQLLVNLDSSESELNSFVSTEKSGHNFRSNFRAKLWKVSIVISGGGDFLSKIRSANVW